MENTPMALFGWKGNQAIRYTLKFRKLYSDSGEVIDGVIIKRNPDETDADVVITACPSGESLEEAGWFFLNCAWPASAYEKTCEDWIAAVIANPEWSERVRAALTSEHST